MDTTKLKQSIKDLIPDKYNAFIALFSKHNFAELKAKDGSLLVYENDLAEGAAIFIVTAEGNQPVPDGVVELEDGTMIEVAGGKITKITKLEAAAPPAQMAEGLTPEIEKAIADYVTKVKDELQGQIDELKTMMGDYKKVEPPDLTDINKKVEDALADLLATKQTSGEKFTAIDEKFTVVVGLMTEIANMPIAPAKEEKFEQKSKREAAIRKMAAAFDKIKK